MWKVSNTCKWWTWISTGEISEESFAAYSKMLEERTVEGRIVKKKSRLDYLENSQPVQISKDAKFGGSLLGEYAVETRPRVWLENLLLVLKILGVWSMDLNCLSRNQEQRWDYPGKILGRSSVSWHESYEMHRRPTNFLIKGEILQHQENDRDGWNGGGLLDSQNFTGKKKSSKTTQLQICFYLKKKFRRMTLRVKSWAQRLEPRTIVDCAQTLKPYVICPAEFWNVLRWLTSSFPFFHFISFLVGMSITVVNVRNHCTLEAGNTGVQMERNLSPL